MAEKKLYDLQISQPGGAQKNDCEAKRRGATASPRPSYKGGNAARNLNPWKGK